MGIFFPKVLQQLFTFANFVVLYKLQYLLDFFFFILCLLPNIRC